VRDRDHQHELAPLHDDDARVGRAVAAPELDAGRRSSGLANPLEQLGELTRQFRLPTLQRVDDAFTEQIEDQAEGQNASMMQATSTPAPAAATPRLVLSLLRTRLK
jgi:hypothetical protein